MRRAATGTVEAVLGARKVRVPDDWPEGTHVDLTCEIPTVKEQAVELLVRNGIAGRATAQGSVNALASAGLLTRDVVTVEPSTAQAPVRPTYRARDAAPGWYVLNPDMKMYVVKNRKPGNLGWWFHGASGIDDSAADDRGWVFLPPEELQTYVNWRFGITS